MSTVSETMPPILRTAAEGIEASTIASSNFITRNVTWIANKIQDIWTFLQPYMVTVGKFMISKLGISLELMGISALANHFAWKEQNTMIAAALHVAGLFAAVAAGFLLCSSGILPSCITQVCPVVSA